MLYIMLKQNLMVQNLDPRCIEKKREREISISITTQLETENVVNYAISLLYFINEFFLNIIR